MKSLLEVNDGSSCFVLFPKSARTESRSVRSRI